MENQGFSKGGGLQTTRVQGFDGGGEMLSCGEAHGKIRVPW